MAKKIKLEITKPQLLCLVDVIDTVSAQIGCFNKEFNKEQSKNVRLLDNMLEKNGYKRRHN